MVGSGDVFAEVQHACRGKSTILLQKLVDDLKGAGKLLIIERDEAITQKAVSLNGKTGGKYGRNDFLHALLAQKHADLLLTSDSKFKPEASKIVKTRLLGEFLSEL